MASDRLRQQVGQLGERADDRRVVLVAPAGDEARGEEQHDGLRHREPQRRQEELAIDAVVAAPGLEDGTASSSSSARMSRYTVRVVIPVRRAISPTATPVLAASPSNRGSRRRSAGAPAGRACGRCGRRRPRRPSRPTRHDRSRPRHPWPPAAMGRTTSRSTTLRRAGRRRFRPARAPAGRAWRSGSIRSRRPLAVRPPPVRRSVHEGPPAARKRPSAPRFADHGALTAPGMWPARGSIGSVSPRYRSPARASSSTALRRAHRRRPRRRACRRRARPASRWPADGSARSVTSPWPASVQAPMPAVEHRAGAVVAEMAVEPPETGRDAAARVVVGDDDVVVADAAGDRGASASFAGDRDGMAAGTLAGRAQLAVRVEEDGARNVTGRVSLASRRAGQRPADVGDSKVRVGAVGRQPVDADERARQAQHATDSRPLRRPRR